MSDKRLPTRLTSWILETPGGALALSGVFFAVCLIFVFQLRFLHDEGVFSHYLARSVPRSFWAGFFFLKTKPPLMLLYALPSLAGLTVFLVFHAALGALTVWLTCLTARRLDITRPNLSGLFLATSLSFMVASSSGFSNLDGCFFLVLFVYLYFSDRKLLAGLLCGLLPFVRHELVLVSVAFFVFEAWRGRSFRFWLGCLAFPLAYWLAGAIYHQNLAWLFTTFPNPEARPVEISGWTPSLGQLGRFLLSSLLINSPVLLLFAFLGFRRRNKESVFLFCLTMGIYLLMTIFQAFAVFGFDFSLRYHVAPLPLFGLLAGFGLSSTSWREKLHVPALVAVGSVVALVLALVLSHHGRRQHVDNHRQMELLMSWPGYSGQVVYVDDVIARYDRCSGVENVHTLADESTRWEIHRFTNKENGQFEQVIRALEQERFLVEPGRHRIDPAAVYLLRDHPRTVRWRERIESGSPERARLGERWLYYWK